MLSMRNVWEKKNRILKGRDIKPNLGLPNYCILGRQFVHNLHDETGQLIYREPQLYCHSSIQWDLDDLSDLILRVLGPMVLRLCQCDTELPPVIVSDMYCIPNGSKYNCSYSTTCILWKFTVSLVLLTKWVLWNFAEVVYISASPPRDIPMKLQLVAKGCKATFSSMAAQAIFSSLNIFLLVWEFFIDSNIRTATALILSNFVSPSHLSCKSKVG